MPLPPTEILSARRRRLASVLDMLGLDAIIVTTPANIRYLTNHGGSAGVLVVTREALRLLVDFRYQSAVAALQDSPGACEGLIQIPVPGSYEEALVDALEQMSVGIVGFEGGHVTVSRHAWWRTALDRRGVSVDLRATDDAIERLRVVKDRAEIASLRDAAERLTDVARRAIAEIRAGVRERDIVTVIEAALREAGYERPAFDAIVASGPNAALPHHRAGDRTLCQGDLVVLDFGGVLDGYCCDLTRTLSIGPPGPEARRVYEAVLEAQLEAIATVRPGVEASAVDAAARAVLDRHGLGASFGHGTGHGLGLDIHEAPRIGRPRNGSSQILLEPGMVFTVEPGAYLPGWGGVRIEDDVLVTEEGCTVLTAAVPKLELQYL